MIQIFLLIRNICSEIFHLTLIRGLILLIELQIILVSYSRFLRRLRIILLPVSHRALELEIERVKDLGKSVVGCVVLE